MAFRCFTCGFVQDFTPTSESVALHHPWMAGKPITDCPSCTQYLKIYGGRKNGKVDMPDITTPGVLEDESDSTIRAKREDIEKDFQQILKDRAHGKLTALRSKYGSKKLWGYSIDDLAAIHDKVKAARTARGIAF